MQNRELIKEQVANSLKQEPNLKGYDIQVSVQEDQVVLQGVVDTLYEKQLAEEIAADVSGIKVDNAISISTDGTVIDKNVEFEVNEELNADPNVRLRDIGVKVDQGTAYLVGRGTPDEVKAAEAAAAKRRGVKEVVSQVKLKKDERIEPPRTAEEAEARGLDS